MSKKTDDPKYLYEPVELIEWLKIKIKQTTDGKTPDVTLSIGDCIDLIKNLEKIFEIEKQSRNYELLANFLADSILEAHRIYAEKGDQDIKLRQIARHFSFTDGKKGRKSEINDYLFYFEYVNLIAGQFDSSAFTKKEPLTKKEAQESLRKKYQFQSRDAVRKKIYRIRKKYNYR